MPRKLITFNGVNGSTGDYGMPQMTGDDLAAFIRGEGKPNNLAELRQRYRSKFEEFLGVREGVNAERLDQAGWGVIFPTYPVSEIERCRDVAAAKEALQPLLKLRGTQAGDQFSAWIQGEGKGFRVGADTKTTYLARHGAGPGPADPRKVPYYLLIVGGPEAIPYRFQYELDVQYAVGRIHFDEPDDYANYAASVVAAETGMVMGPRRAAFFGVANPNDGATNQSTDNLIEPLCDRFAAEPQGWEIKRILRSAATKAALHKLLGGTDTPALLVTASHGMEFAQEDVRQIPHQGALLCQDWPGPLGWPQKKPIPHDYYFAGEDLDANAKLDGMIAFFFACYGAGTPDLDEFSKQAFKDRRAIAPYPFVANLPKHMLTRPCGGALAVIGHIERAWTYSFDWPSAGIQTAVFESTLRRLLMGQPVGLAAEFFNERYAELSTVLAGMLEDIEFGKTYDPYTLADMWTANNDARGYAIIGDPAVHLAAACNARAGGLP